MSAMLVVQMVVGQETYSFGSAVQSGEPGASTLKGLRDIHPRAAGYRWLASLAHHDWE